MAQNTHWTTNPYRHNDGYVTGYYHNERGVWGTVYVAESQGIDTNGRYYAVVCESHGNLYATDLLRIAKAMARDTAEFCFECQKGTPNA